MVKLPRYARPNARRSFEACSTGPLGGYNRCELTCSQLRVELSERIVSITLIASTPGVVVAIENRTGKDATGRGWSYSRFFGLFIQILSSVGHATGAATEL